MPKRKHEDEASGHEENWKHEDELVNQCRAVWKEHMETKHSFVYAENDKDGRQTKEVQKLDPLLVRLRRSTEGHHGVYGNEGFSDAAGCNYHDVVGGRHGCKMVVVVQVF